MNCAGSVDLAAKQPEGATSFAAAEGTFAHDIAATHIRSNGVMAAKDCLGVTGTVYGHAIICDQDMVDGVQLYLDTIAGLKLDVLHVELNITPALQQWDRDAGGTADYVTYSLPRKLLRVFDFKYGAGMFVSADDNKQLKIYALGVLLTIKQPIDFVEVYIVQPRFEGAEPVRKQAFAAFDLMEFAG